MPIFWQLWTFPTLSIIEIRGLSESLKNIFNIVSTYSFEYIEEIFVNNSMLPKEIISLIHHIELNKGGWWERSLQQMILSILLMAGKPLDVKEITKHLERKYSIYIDKLKAEKIINGMISSNILISLNNGKYKMYENIKKDLETQIQETDELEKRVKEKFIKLLVISDLKLDHEEIWKRFNEAFLFPLIREIGAKTYELISGNTIKIGATKSLNSFLTNYSEEHRTAIKDTILSFLDPKDPYVRACIFQQLNAYFLLEACNLQDENLEALNKFSKNPPSFTLFVDTNFLFSILEIHENPANDTAKLLLEIVNQLENKIDIKFKVLSTTIDESRRVMAGYQYSLENVVFTKKLANASINDRVKLSGYAQKFIQVYNSSDCLISVKQYYQYNINNLITILSSKNVELYEQEVSKYKIDQRVVNDVHDRLEFENKRYGKNAKNYEKLEHDLLMWYVVKDKRPNRVESPLDAKYWIVTLDFRLMGFDAFKNRNIPNQIPLCIHPTALIQMLQLWLPRTSKLEEAVLSSLKPIISQDFDHETEKTTLDILRALSRFENVDNLSQEVIVKILINDALRQRISGEKDLNTQIELIKEELVEENAEISKKYEELNQDKESLNEKYEEIKREKKTLVLNYETVEEEKQELTENYEHLENEYKKTNEKLKNIEKQLTEKNKEQLELKERMTQIEKNDERKNHIKRFNIVFFLSALCSIVIILVTIKYLTNHYSGVPFLICGSILTCGIVSSVWTTLTHLYGSKKSMIQDYYLFTYSLMLKNKINYMIGCVICSLIASGLLLHAQ